MRSRLTQLIRCPECGHPLTLDLWKKNGDRIEEGVLLCEDCPAYYVVTKFIPRMVPLTLVTDTDFLKKYEQKLKVLVQKRSKQEDAKNALATLQEATVKNFGTEWKMWDSFGWTDESVAIEQSKHIFDYKVLFTPKELVGGKLVLDAGCGNGRYTKVASMYGGEVIGVDLSDAVDVAYNNTKDDPHIHIVQGDLFKLPFAKDTFDFVFSNGVLMHTGDARKAFLSIASHLKDDGVITVHLYHKGNPLYEFNDWWLRAITTRLPLDFMYKVSCFLAAIVRPLPKKFVQYGLNIFLRIENHPHYVFDWYTAPIATHHTYPELYRWLDEAGLHLVADHNKSNHPWRKWIVPFFFLTVKAQKQPFIGEVTHTTT
ncbi:MAG: methyltransferase domain-containing protein [Candidatus Pacebacteria bacterium]|nr:methyltransferase domain-containing protein [Candidatus Paceibacterota bacterium]